MSKVFLKAKWEKLILANYEVSPEPLSKYVPAGTELDLWNNICYVSLVGFMFTDTKVKGCKIPGHINFEEVNLRFYIKREEDSKTKRGVAFIKEIVPKPLITKVARSVYKEPYETCKMTHQWNEKENQLIIGYNWLMQNHWNQIEVVVKNQPISFDAGSEADFITEHYWGYTRINAQTTNEYEVTHPQWKIYPVEDFNIQVDFGLNYGNEFKILNTSTPKSVMLAEGATITVGNKRKITI